MAAQAEILLTSSFCSMLTWVSLLTSSFWERPTRVRLTLRMFCKISRKPTTCSVSIHGPAVADVERAFAGVWAETGAPLPSEDEHPHADRIPPAGEQLVRVIVQEPRRMRTLR